MQPNSPPGWCQHSAVLPSGITLNVVERPASGPPALFLHCAWGSWRNWLPLLQPEPVALAGRRLLLLDLRGHGGSSKPATGYRLRDYTADLLAFIHAEALVNLVLAGHSLGALIQLLVLAAAPDRVQALLLEDPPLPFPRVAADVDQDWRDLRTTTAGYFALKRLPHAAMVERILAWEPGLDRPSAEQFAASLTATADGVFRAVLTGASAGTIVPVPDVRHALPALVLPAGDPRRRALLPAGIDQLRAVLPRARVEIVPATGHDVLRDNPAGYRRLVEAWLLGEVNAK